MSMATVSAWRPQGSPLPYTQNGQRTSYGSGDPCGRHARTSWSDSTC